MSLEKIQSILADPQMIGYQLISSTLGEVLVEMCQIITEQSEQIRHLKSQSEDFAIKKDYEQFKSETNSSLMFVKKQILRNDEKIEDYTKETFEKIDKLDYQVNKKVNETKDNIVKKYDEEISIIKDDFGFAKDQIMVLFSNQGKLKSELIDHSNNVENVKKQLELQKERSIDTLYEKSEKVEKHLNDLDKRFLMKSTELNEKIESGLSSTNDDLKETKRQIGFIKKDTSELRRMIIDVPTFDIDGKIDFGSIVRSIQRDSRRIDSFNETIISIRDEHNDLRSMMISLLSTLAGINENYGLLVQDYNTLKPIIVSKSESNRESIDIISTSVFSLSSKVCSITDSIYQGLNHISGVFYSIIPMLSSINKSLPSIKPLDNIIISIQKIMDSVNQQNDYSQKSISKIQYPNDTTLSNQFQFLPIIIPSLSATKHRSLDVNIGKQPIQSGGELFDPQARQDIEVLKNKFSSLNTLLEELKESVMVRIDRKADSVATERIFEKLRSSISNMKDQIATLSKQISVCVQREDITSILHQSGFQNSEEPVHNIRPNTTSSRQAPPTLNLPQFTAPLAHEAIYGKDDNVSTRSLRTPFSSQRVRKPKFKLDK